MTTLFAWIKYKLMAAKRFIAHHTVCRVAPCTNPNLAIDTASFCPCTRCGCDAFNGQSLEGWAASEPANIENFNEYDDLNGLEY